jgi:hypothetical protein
MEKSEGSGLSVEYDEESGSFHLEWDPETHHNGISLRILLRRTLVKCYVKQAETILKEHEDTKVHNRGIE